MNIDATIDAFRRGVLDLDCKKIILRQRKDGGEVYEGPGYIRQTREGALTFKLYVIGRKNVRPLARLTAEWLAEEAARHYQQGTTHHHLRPLPRVLCFNHLCGGDYST